MENRTASRRCMVSRSSTMLESSRKTEKGVHSCESDLQAQSLPDDQPAPPAGTTQNFPPLAQPLPAGPADASSSGSVPPFLVGRFDWLLPFFATGYESGGLPKVPVRL